MIGASPWNHVARMSVAAFLVTLATSGQAQEQTFKAVSVETPDGLTRHAVAQCTLHPVAVVLMMSMRCRF